MHAYFATEVHGKPSCNIRLMSSVQNDGRTRPANNLAQLERFGTSRPASNLARYSAAAVHVATALCCVARQALAQGPVDSMSQVDVYVLNSCIWQLCAGCWPFQMKQRGKFQAKPEVTIPLPLQRHARTTLMRPNERPHGTRPDHVPALHVRIRLR